MTPSPAPTLCALEAVFQRCFFDDDLRLAQDTTACDVDGWDSLAHVRLLMMIDQHFGIALDPARTTRLKNVGDLVRLIDDELARCATATP